VAQRLGAAVKATFQTTLGFTRSAAPTRKPSDARSRICDRAMGSGLWSKCTSKRNKIHAASLEDLHKYMARRIE